MSQKKFFSERAGLDRIVNSEEFWNDRETNQAEPDDEDDEDPCVAEESTACEEHINVKYESAKNSYCHKFDFRKTSVCSNENNNILDIRTSRSDIGTVLVNELYTSRKLKKPANFSCYNRSDVLSDEKTFDVDVVEEEIEEKSSSTVINVQSKYLRNCGCSSIMIVDDSPFNLLILKEILNRIIPPKYQDGVGCNAFKWRIDEASNGLKALELVKSTINNTCWRGYELILMDLSMPIMDGWTSAMHMLELKKSGKVQKHLKIVPITAYDSQEHKHKCSSSGMTGFLNKPVSIEDITTVLESTY